MLPHRPVDQGTDGRWLITKTPKNSGKTASGSAVFSAPHGRRPRISAEDAMSFADDFRQIQQKQREPPPY
jgi:hypothetical protein